MMITKAVSSKRLIFTFFLVVVLIINLVAQVLITPQVSAWGCDESGREQRADFYARNNIPSFNDPCESSACASGSGSLTGPAPTSLEGEDNAEKTWNYFTSRGLSPVAAAGAMGNIEHESGFNPWIGESGSTSINPGDLGSGFGLIQWTNTGGNSQGRRYGVMKAMEAAGINLSNVNQADQAQTDIALLIQLNWLWDGEYGKMTWAEEVNAETTVEGDTTIASYNGDFSGSLASSQAGNGSTMVFHALVERSGDVPTQADKDSNSKYRNNGVLTNRIEGAKAWLEKFGGGSGSCTISEGGLTEEQASKLMEYYKHGDPDVLSFITCTVGDCICSGADLREQATANCTNFSDYFTNKFTSYQGVSTNGNKVVNGMAAANPGGKTGPEPQVFSIFSGGSGFGHTGVVLGIEGENLIIGEASCNRGHAGTRAYKTTLSELQGLYPGLNFFYAGDGINTEELNKVING